MRECVDVELVILLFLRMAKSMYRRYAHQWELLRTMRLRHASAGRDVRRVPFQFVVELRVINVQQSA